MASSVVPPTGSVLAGFFVAELVVDETLPPGILADAVDPRTGELLSISSGFEPTDAALLAALGIERGSGAAVESVGHRFGDLEILDQSAHDFIRAEFERTLDVLVKDRQIVITSITPLTGDNWAEGQIVYRNVAQNKRREASIVVGTQ